MYPLYKRLRRFQGRIVWGRKISPSQKIEIRPSISLLDDISATLFRLPVPSLQIKWSSRCEIWPHLAWINFFRKNILLLPWRWRQHVLAKRWEISTRLHEVIQRFNIRKRSSYWLLCNVFQLITLCNTLMCSSMGDWVGDWITHELAY